MENPSDTESSQLLGDWDSDSLVNPQGTHVPNEADKAIDKESVPTSNVAREGKQVATKRVLPPSMDPSYEWGDGKYKQDGRKLKKKAKEKEKEKEKAKEKEKEKAKEIEKEKEKPLPFKEIIEALLRNSGEKLEEMSGPPVSYVEILKAKGFKFPK